MSRYNYYEPQQHTTLQEDAEDRRIEELSDNE